MFVANKIKKKYIYLYIIQFIKYIDVVCLRDNNIDIFEYNNMWYINTSVYTILGFKINS